MSQSEYKHLHIHNSSGTMGHSVKDFLPLIAMIAVVLGFMSFGVWYFGQNPMLAFMGYFFLVFGFLKVVRIHSFVEAYKMYDVVAKRSKLYAYSYPFLELGFALAYLLVWQVQIVSGLVMVVMLIGAYGVYQKLRQKEEIPCACLGTVFKIPMTWVTLGEDLLMAGMAFVILWM